MVKVSNYTWERIQALTECGLQPLTIFKQLQFEGLQVSYPSVVRIVSKVKLTRSIKNSARSGRPRKLNEAGKSFIEVQMRTNDETTSRQIQKRLAKRGIMVHSSTVRRYRKEQSWTLLNTRYCQMIRKANKAKRLEFAQRVINTGDTFDNVVFSDESSISLEHLLPKDRWTYEEETQTKTPFEASCVGWHQQTWGNKDLHLWRHYGG